ncbi:MAG: SMC-Scp complex subunit ScpB [Firmicutes bacterium]|nr:SMC-Scp complex subunit ScpB [Bacillota bacterium]
MTEQSIKSALESLLFVWGEPLEARTLAELFQVSPSEMTHMLRSLARDYEERGSGLLIREMDKSFQLCTNPVNDDYITRLCTPVKEKKLTQAALEVLAVVAYKQPVTRSEIESVRGVKSEKVLDGLMDRRLIEEKGRSTKIGRPILYGTTKEFLRLFGFETLNDLPLLEDIDDLTLDEAFNLPLEGQESLPGIPGSLLAENDQNEE